MERDKEREREMRQLLAFSKVTVLCVCHDKEKKKMPRFHKNQSNTLTHTVCLNDEQQMKN